MTDIFEEVVSIHPNMNNAIIYAFNNSKMIQELLRKESFFGEFDFSNISQNDLNRFLVVDYKTAVIQILSIREDGESLKVKFKFLESEFANNIKKLYLENKNQFCLKTRTIANDPNYPKYNKDLGLFLVTFDLYKISAYNLNSDYNDKEGRE